MNSEAVKVAATWWADQLSAPAKMDNGEAMHGIMGMLAQATNDRLSPAEIEQFQHELESEITNSGREYVTISVDYDPDMTLRSAAQRAGINLNMRLPWKTTMWIDGDTIKVSSGYRAPIEQIYPL